MKKQFLFAKGHCLWLIVLILMATATNSQGIRTIPEKAEAKFKILKSEIYNELLRRAAKKNNKILKDTIPVPVNRLMSNMETKSILETQLLIYGDDNRRNPYDADVTPELRTDAEKVACLVKRNQLKKNTDGTYSLISAGSYGQMYKLCDEEKYVREPAVAFCSGFAVSDKLFVTAGHCMEVTDVSNMVIVYGYRVKPNGVPNLVISPNDIYEPQKILGKEVQGHGNDYAVIKIKESFPSTRIVPVRQTGMVPDDEPVHVIGYPCGLPVKITPGASVFNNTVPSYFVINSDTYKGNSGSPVFNSKTHVVEGILVRGGDDFGFIELTNCNGSVRCPQAIGNCRGEDVSRVSQFLNLINKQ
jgi:hypothetical protein